MQTTDPQMLAPMATAMSSSDQTISNTQGSSGTEQTGAPTDDADPDDELSLEIATEALLAARHSFQTKDYAESNAYLQEARAIVRDIPPTSQSICSEWELQYMLSVCAYHIQDPGDAERELRLAIDYASTSEDQSSELLLQQSRLFRYLSRVCLKLEKLEQAYAACENALRIQRRLLGKDHEETYETVALIAQILHLQGQEQRAKVYLRLIPDAERAKFATSSHNERGLPPGEVHELPALDHAASRILPIRSPKRRNAPAVHSDVIHNAVWERQRYSPKDWKAIPEKPSSELPTRALPVDVAANETLYSAAFSSSTSLLPGRSIAHCKTASDVYQRPPPVSERPIGTKSVPSIAELEGTPGTRGSRNEKGMSLLDFLKNEETVASGDDDLQKFIVLHTTEGEIHLHPDISTVRNPLNTHRRSNWSSFLRAMGEGWFNGAEVHRDRDKDSDTGTAIICYASSTSAKGGYATLCIHSAGKAFYCERKGPDGWYTFGDIEDSRDTLLALMCMNPKLWTKKLDARVKWCEVR